MNRQAKGPWLIERRSSCSVWLDLPGDVQVLVRSEASSGEVAATVSLLAAVPDLIAWAMKQVDDEGAPGELGAILVRAGVR